jgi:4-hydroxy-tetrahydrodipicolinate reductase
VSERGVSRLGIIGDGRMGMAVAELARARGTDVVVILSEAENPDGAAIASGALEGVDCAIEFSQPGSAVANALACVRAGVPVVIGTTGWYGRLAEVETAVRAANGSLLWAPNFSAGVVLLTALVERAGELFRGAGFDAHMVETHHTAKLDSPSGTASSLAQAFEAAGQALPITSVRLGHVPGTHEITLDAAYEQVTIAHTARDRRVFADGALRAAAWLVGRHGVYTMRDVLGLEPRSRP